MTSEGWANEYWTCSSSASAASCFSSAWSGSSVSGSPLTLSSDYTRQPQSGSRSSRYPGHSRDATHPFHLDLLLGLSALAPPLPLRPRVDRIVRLFVLVPQAIPRSMRNTSLLLVRLEHLGPMLRFALLDLLPLHTVADDLGVDGGFVEQEGEPGGAGGSLFFQRQVVRDVEVHGRSRSSESGLSGR